MTKAGKVWLVGGGPSDSGLMTLKGKKCLERADVVIYDNLVGQGVLSMIPAGTETISVGKIAGHHPIPQEEINRIIYREAKQGKRVVRLKGGDPFLFGRGGEELELLCEHGIPFEIVPGITSAIAVPAYHGIPVTHRDICSSVHIITGHTKKAEEPDIDFEALVRLKGTLIFLMGVTSMEKICKGLLKSGMDPAMPAAVLERGTTARQRRVVSNVSKLWEDAFEAQIKAPAIIVVGGVCALAEDFHWAEDRPLGGCKIAVTRPKDRSSRLAEKLTEHGAEVVLLPTIETKLISENAALSAALEKIDDYRWIAFTSTAGVEGFFQAMTEKRMDIRSLAGLKFAAIGTATQKAIESRGILVELIPDVYSGAALGQALAARLTGQERLLIPRAKIGTDEVLKPLIRANVSFDDVAVYDTEETEPKVGAAYDETVDYVAFTSASTVRGFVQLNPGLDFSKVKAVCIGEMTRAEAVKHGMETTVAAEATMDSMVELLLREAGR